MTNTPDFYRPAVEAACIGADPHAIADALEDLWAERYRRLTGSGADLVVFDHGGASYLFDSGDQQTAPRTIAAFGIPRAEHDKRSTSYQAGFPLAELPGRPVDRGHLFPHSAGGLYGPNLFRQDRALNRGHSRDGRLYRSIEIRAVRERAFFFCSLVYCDDTDMPAVIELGILVGSDLQITAFRNRFDRAAITAHPTSTGTLEQFRELLSSLPNNLIGDLGEETARAWLEDACGAIIVDAGDSSAERDASRQKLDLAVVLDGEFLAVEVKTRYHARSAGRLTNKGNLPRPRFRRAGSPSPGGTARPRQGTPDYAAMRLGGTLERPTDGVVATIVVAVDLKSMHIQLFPVDDLGHIGAPPSPVEDCTEYALAGVSAILDHAGHLS